MGRIERAFADARARGRNRVRMVNVVPCTAATPRRQLTSGPIGEDTTDMASVVPPGVAGSRATVRRTPPVPGSSSST